MRESTLYSIAFWTVFISMFSLVFAAFIDVLTIQETGEESVPCLDKFSRPFEDEMCTETLYCSWLGFVAEERCVNVLEDEA